MKLCFAATNSRKNLFENGLRELRFVLESHYYMKPWQVEQIKHIEHFMLDSGAFTFLQSKRAVDIDEYVDGYIRFINQHDIEHFFELDIDSIIGYDEVKKIRQKIERRTKKRCIPVWHKSRGIKEFRAMCRKYDYVAIGGIASKEIDRSDFFLLNAFCDLAKSYGCKIHGLGFTPNNLKDFHFDSVDSTSWKSGGMYGLLYTFKDGMLTSEKMKDRKHYLDIDRHNLKQFLAMQDYLNG